MNLREQRKRPADWLGAALFALVRVPRTIGEKKKPRHAVSVAA